MLRSDHLPCAVYFRPAVWKGPWKLHVACATRKAAHNQVEFVLREVTPRGEVAIFAASTEPALDSNHQWPTSFKDGAEGLRLVYQITAAYQDVERRLIEET